MTCFRMEDGTSLLQWCKANGYHYHMLYRRLDEGMGLKEAIQDVDKLKTKDRSLYSRPTLYWDGKPIVDLYDKRSYNLILQRRHIHGMTLEQAIKAGKLKKKEG